MKKFGILFDLDGTLLDTLGDLTDSVNSTLEHYGFPLRTQIEVRSYLGNGARKLIELACGGQGDIDEMLAFYQSYYKSHCRIKTAPYPHIPEVLKILGEKYALAVVSNKPDIATKALCADIFPGLPARGEAADCPRKPAPDMLLKIKEELSIDDFIYVGDSEVDVITAKNAGVPCVSVLWGFRDRPEIEAEGGKYFIEDARELPAMIEKILGEKNGK